MIFFPRQMNINTIDGDYESHLHKVMTTIMAIIISIATGYRTQFPSNEPMQRIQKIKNEKAQFFCQFQAINICYSLNHVEQ